MPIVEGSMWRIRAGWEKAEEEDEGMCFSGIIKRFIVGSPSFPITFTQIPEKLTSFCRFANDSLSMEVSNCIFLCLWEDGSQLIGPVSVFVEYSLVASVYWALALFY